MPISLSLDLLPLSFLEPLGKVRVPLPCLKPAEKNPSKFEPSWYLKRYDIRHKSFINATLHLNHCCVAQGSGSPYFASALLLIVGVPSGVDTPVPVVSCTKMLEWKGAFGVYRLFLGRQLTKHIINRITINYCLP